MVLTSITILLLFFIVNSICSVIVSIKERTNKTNKTNKYGFLCQKFSKIFKNISFAEHLHTPTFEAQMITLIQRGLLSHNLQ